MQQQQQCNSEEWVQSAGGYGGRTAFPSLPKIRSSCSNPSKDCNNMRYNFNKQIFLGLIKTSGGCARCCLQRVLPRFNRRMLCSADTQRMLVDHTLHAVDMSGSRRGAFSFLCSCLLYCTCLRVAAGCVL